MIKDGKDTDYNRLGYYPHYWIDSTSDSFCLIRTTNLRDVHMRDEKGHILTGMYADLWGLAQKLNRRNTERAHA